MSAAALSPVRGGVGRCGVGAAGGLPGRCNGAERCVLATPVVASPLCALPFARRRAAQGDVLPLHVAAGFGASEAVVEALLAAYPGAIKEENSVRLPYLDSSRAAFALSRAGRHAAQLGMLPLHVAVGGSNDAVVLALLAAHPVAAKKADKVARAPDTPVLPSAPRCLLACALSRARR